MLDAGRGISHGVPITLCSGLKGIDAIPGFAPIDHVHGTHHAGHQHDSSLPHFTAACGMWSAGASFISVAFIETVFAGPPPDLYLVDHERRKAIDSVARTRFARAPPRLT